MLVTAVGICGETLFFDPTSIEFAYEITMLGKQVMYLGMKTGKKLFLDMNKEDFSKLLEKVQS